MEERIDVSVCLKCQRKMRAMFISYACDYCDGLIKEDKQYNSAFVLLFRNMSYEFPIYDHLFKTYDDALKWASFLRDNNFQICEVYAEASFKWETYNVKGINVEYTPALFKIFSNKNSCKDVDKNERDYCFLAPNVVI